MLAERIANAGRAQVSTADPPLLPFDAVREYLDDHVLLRNVGCAPREVYDVLVALHAHVTRAPAPSRAPPPVPSPTCPHCRVGSELLDAREGCRVCDRCGAVLTRAINVTREYVAAEPPPFEPRLPAVPGVSEWIVRENAAHVVADEAQRPSAYFEDLEHWNAYAHVPHDELRKWDRVLRDWSGSGSRRARVCAALLYARLAIPDAADVRRCALRRVRLPSVVVPVPEAAFACGVCGTLVHRQRDARFHCRWQSRKRRRNC